MFELKKIQMEQQSKMFALKLSAQSITNVKPSHRYLEKYKSPKTDDYKPMNSTPLNIEIDAVSPKHNKAEDFSIPPPDFVKSSQLKPNL